MISSSPPPSGSMRTVPGLIRVRSGMCSGRMPSSPASPGAMTRCARPEKIACSAETMSTCSILAMFVPLLQGLRLLERFLDLADHVESLRRQVVALAVHNHVEAADRVLQRHVLARRAGEDLGHVERLRKAALEL